MRRFQHEGLSFHYREAGEGTPFVFQHGLSSDISQPFSLFQPHRGFRLLAFDCRGHGKTCPFGDLAKISLATFADDLRAFLDHADIDRAVIGGISMGAAVALNFALRYPRRVRGLVLARPAWLEAPNPWNVEHFSQVTRLIREHGGPAGLALYKATEAYQQVLQASPAVAATLAAQFEAPNGLQSAALVDRIINDRPQGDRNAWGKIRVPTLVLANQQDPVHPFEYGQALAEAIPDAWFREIAPKSVSPQRHAVEMQRSLKEFLDAYFAGGADENSVLDDF